MDLHERVRVGQEAKRFLDDPVMQRCIQRVSDNLSEQILNSAPGEAGRDVREAAHFKLNALVALIGDLHATVTDGKIAAKKLEDLNTND